MEEGAARCAELIERAKKGKLELLPGCTLEQSLESSLTGVLNGLRESAGGACMQVISRPPASQLHTPDALHAECEARASSLLTRASQLHTLGCMA